jgi:hypothetical protein
MTVQQLVPVMQHRPLDELLVPFIARGAVTMPFAPDAIALALSLGRRIARDGEARKQPALQALAFWLRKTELLRLQSAVQRIEGDGTVLVPRGTVFHLPPANVDTLFVYSWILALLAGNRNVVRLSSRGVPQASVLVRLVNEALAEHAGTPAGDGTVMLSYGHDVEITRALSAVCDVRVIWGGDATVNAVRAVPLPPRAIELAFPDRYSFAALNAAAVVALDDEALAALADRVYIDTYWFDQLGCSSPRVLVWVGSAADCATAGRRFVPALHARVRARGYGVDVGTALAKRTFAFRTAIDTEVESVHWVANELAVIELAELGTLVRDHPGGGLLFQVGVERLDALAPILTARDQTLSHFGFERAELVSFVHRLGASAFDRLVPVGSALQFDRIWDGFDLIAQFTRNVTVTGS